LIFVFKSPSTPAAGRQAAFFSPETGFEKKQSLIPPETLNNLSLNEEQCRASFPGLNKEIDDVVAQGPFKVKQNIASGPLQGGIKNGQIFIIHAERKRDLSREMVNSRTAAIHQLHRAIITSPDPIPDTIFSLNYLDQPFGAAWTYSRPAAAPSSPPPSSTNAHRSFLMPHFSFWAWNLPFVGSMSLAAERITALESTFAPSHGGQWADKIPKAVWRGTAFYNSVQSPQLRQNLVNTAKGKPWADVEPLKWAPTDTDKGTRNATNALKVEEFCRYKYVIHTEGIAYSGRFQFLQMCKSVVITTPVLWMQHVTHLVRPLFSGTLDLHFGGMGRRVERGLAGHGDGNGEGGVNRTAAIDNTGSTAPAHQKRMAQPARTTKKNKHWPPSQRTLKAWPTQYPPTEANMVFVAPDWSDLEDTIAWLEANPDVAEGIAHRQRELFVGGGYFSPAAEACYWRALVRGWAKVAKTEGEGWEEPGKEGVPFEQFVLNNEL